MTIIEQLVRSIPQADRREIEDWAGGSPPNFEHPAIDFGAAEAFKGRFDVRNVPWNREFLRLFKSLHVREITVVAPPQESGKTKTAEVCMAWRIVKKPAKMAFNSTTNTKAKTWYHTRWTQLQTACRPLVGKLSSNPDHETQSRTVFADQTFLLVQGVETDSNRQGDSVEVQINDEVHLWPRPYLSEMHTRTRAYRETRKIVNISVGGLKGSELHEKFLEGSQLEWSHHCPSCTRAFQYVFEQKNRGCNIHFDMTKVKVRKDGGFDFREFDKTVFVRCPHCEHRMEWSEELLSKLNEAGTMIAMNPDAPPELASIHVSSFAIGRRPWAEIIHPWARMHHRGGVFGLEDLRKFICEDLAEFWEEKPMVVSKELRLGAYTRQQMLKPGPIYGDFVEAFRLMAVDNQHGSQGDIPHRWFVVRSFAQNGDSRLVDCGRVDEWSELRLRQYECLVRDWSKGKLPFVVVDRRHNPVEVDNVCADFQWFGLQGTEQDFFIHGRESPFHGVQQLFSEGRFMGLGFGTKESGRRWACYYLWSSHKIQDILSTLKTGGSNIPAWEVPSDINEFCPEYAEQINSHRQDFEKDRNGNTKRIWKKIAADHLHDCESELVVLASMAGVIKMTQ